MTNSILTALNQFAETYVKLVLAVGQHDADYVDAFYGPPEWMDKAKSQRQSLEQIKSEAMQLKLEVELLDSSAEEELIQLRHRYVTTQLSALIARVEMLGGKKLSFDEEAKALYDAIPPMYPEAYFQKLINELDTRLPGRDPIPKRVEQYRKQFTIAHDKLDLVFQAAIHECRERTKRYIRLPENEQFRIEYVRNKSWSGYNWYKGGNESLIQINTDLPIFLERAIDLAAHEGYPGHHVYNCLLETEFARARGWIEFTAYALFSPQSLIAEGTANFGINVAFPGTERTAFERDVLFPIAHLDKSEAENYSAVIAITEKINYAHNEAARKYLNGACSREDAAQWLVQYALMSPERALQRTRFFDQYRSYVINYNLGQDLVKRYIENHGGIAEHPEKRWSEFLKLISSPRLPSGLL